MRRLGVAGQPRRTKISPRRYQALRQSSWVAVPLLFRKVVSWAGVLSLFRQVGRLLAACNLPDFLRKLWSCNARDITESKFRRSKHPRKAKAPPF